jgi:hypothetical protein
VKIVELDLRAFGPFTGVRLDLAGGDPGLHLIYGPNEAGKSSALRALHQMFFGIPHQTPDDFLHKYKDMLVGATLRDGDGPALGFLRRKANTRTLLEADARTSLDDSALGPFLGGVTPEEYARLFCLDHQTLSRGAGPSSRGAATWATRSSPPGRGSPTWARSAKSWRRRRARLFLSEGRTGPTINKTLADLKKAREAKKAAALRCDEWESHERQRRASAAQKGEVDRELDGLRSRVNRLKRIGDALPAIAAARACWPTWRPWPMPRSCPPTSPIGTPRPGRCGGSPRTASGGRWRPWPRSTGGSAGSTCRRRCSPSPTPSGRSTRKSAPSRRRPGSGRSWPPSARNSSPMPRRSSATCTRAGPSPTPSGSA